PGTELWSLSRLRIFKYFPMEQGNKREVLHLIEKNYPLRDLRSGRKTGSIFASELSTNSSMPLVSVKRSPLGNASCLTCARPMDSCPPALPMPPKVVRARYPASFLRPSFRKTTTSASPTIPLTSAQDTSSTLMKKSVTCTQTSKNGTGPRCENMTPFKKRLLTSPMLK